MALEAFRAGDFARAASLGRRRIAAEDRPGAYTLQVLVACEESTLGRMRDRLPASDDLLLVRSQLGGRSCYRVCWGIYGSRAAAEAARGEVPSYFTSGGDRPMAVPLSRLSP